MGKNGFADGPPPFFEAANPFLRIFGPARGHIFRKKRKHIKIRDAHNKYTSVDPAYVGKRATTMAPPPIGGRGGHNTSTTVAPAPKDGDQRRRY